MIIVDDIRTVETGLPEVVLTVGSFDGVHLGHRSILQLVVEHAKQRNGTAAVLTLRPHPRAFFTPEHAPNLLTTDQKKFALLEEAGIDALFVLPFDATTAALSPDTFARDIIHQRCGAKLLVVGHDFRFGQHADGDYDLLVNIGREAGFDVTEAPALLLDGERVSSTFIREQLLLGDLETVERFLGRPYSMTGVVVPGRQIGVTLGFPTANIHPHHTAIPAKGVYCCEAIVDEDRYAAAVNVGIAPTIRNEDLTIEAFLLNFSGNLESSSIELVFQSRLRDEMKFPSKDALVEQIRRDVEAVRAALLS
jgi:riboflavin kinase/FMN adenylyltransferase